MLNFDNYAEYYNLLYKDKDYSGEVEYIDNLIKKFYVTSVKTVLNIGCGTGKHDHYLNKIGYKTLGIDISEKMIELAKKEYENLNFLCNSAQKFHLNRKFDVILSLFHVMNYHISNNDLFLAIKNTSNHLNKNGLFIFDFWYGPAVLLDHPYHKELKIENSKLIVKRETNPRICFNENVVDVNFNCKVIVKNSLKEYDFDELHRMRYLFLPELEDLLSRNGLEILDALKWGYTDIKLDEKSWYGVIIAKKIK